MDKKVMESKDMYGINTEERTQHLIKTCEQIDVMLEGLTVSEVNTIKEHIEQRVKCSMILSFPKK